MSSKLAARIESRAIFFTSGGRIQRVDSALNISVHFRAAGIDSQRADPLKLVMSKSGIRAAGVFHSGKLQICRMTVIVHVSQLVEVALFYVALFLY